MPKIKDFETNKPTKKTAAPPIKTKVAMEPETESPGSLSQRRRPGRDSANSNSEILSDVKVVIVETGEELKMDSQQNKSSTNETTQNDFGSKDGPKVEIKFPGSEILRAKFAKPFEVAESIATDWVHDGKFEGLPLGHPLAQYFAAKGLQKAKRMEKKVLESPVTEKVAMQALQAGMKAQEIIAQVRAKVKK